jgi:hypothetical protein
MSRTGMVKGHNSEVDKLSLDWLISFGLILLAVALYGASLRYPFFWDDPVELGRAQARSIVTLFTASRDYLYYRPLTFTLWKAIGALQGRFDPFTFHLIQVVTHALNGVLTYTLARRLFRQRAVAAIAAALFVLYPLSYQAVTWVAVAQVQVTTLLLGTLIAYHDGRMRKDRKLLWLSLALTVVALPMHENGMTFWVMVVALEGMLLRRERAGESWGLFLRRKVVTWWPFPALYLLASVGFFLIWLFIPKSASLSQLAFRPAVGQYLLQGLIWPVAGALGAWVHVGLVDQGWWPLTVVAMVTLAWLLVAYGRGKQLPLLSLAVLWFVVTEVPVWLTQAIGYVGLAPRLFYIASPAVALVWAGLLGLDIRLPGARSWWGWRAWQIAASVLMAAVAWQCVDFVSVRNRVYAGVMPAVWNVVRQGAEAGASAKLLFVNVPDRVTPYDRQYPVGDALVMVMPIDRDLASYVALHTGVRPTTESLSVPELAGLGRYPYFVNMRGVIAQPDALTQAIRTADQVFFAEYHTDGTVRVVEAGSVSSGQTSGKPLATLGTVLQLQQATFEPSGRLVLQWMCLGPGIPGDTVFVHVTGEDGKPIVQADGDPLRGLWLLEYCQAGERIRDVRSLPVENIPTGQYFIRVGVYNRMTSERLSARDALGEAIPNDSIVAVVWKKP